MGVTVVYASGIATAIAEKARQPATFSEAEKNRQRADFQKLLKLSPDIAGERIVQGIERRTFRLLVGKDAAIVDPLVWLAPISSWKVCTFLNPKKVSSQ